jgi:hypothetical protein
MNLTTQQVESALTKNELRKIRGHQRAIVELALHATARLAAQEISKAVWDAGCGPVPEPKRKVEFVDPRRIEKERRERKVPRQIRTLALQDAFLYSWLTGYLHGAYNSWREALEAIVVAQALHASDLGKQLLMFYRHERPSIFLSPGDVGMVVRAENFEELKRMVEKVQEEADAHRS